MMISFIAEAAVRSSALIAAVWVLLKVCRVRDPSGEKLAWTLVAVASLAIPLLMWSIVEGAMPLAVVPMRLTSSVVGAADLPPETPPLGPVLLAVYFLGLGLFSVRLAVGLLIGARLRSHAQRVPEQSSLDVRMSAEVQSPVSFGSTVILPACSVGWDARTLRAVLAHEHEHIRNYDAYRLWLAGFCKAVFWFNPLFHWLYRRLSILSELTSDTAAVGAIGERAAYVNVLLQIAAGESSLQATVPMATRSTLPGRVRLLLARDEPSAGVSTPRKVLLGAGVMLLGAVIAAYASAPPVLTTAAAGRYLKVRDPPDLDEICPTLRPHISARALVRITVDATGRVVHTDIAEETPSGVGMASFAECVARSTRFTNSLHRSVITTMPVKIVLQ